MFELIIFDFDGVLVLSNRAHIEASRKALEKAGVTREVSKEELTSNFGKSYRAVLKAVMGEEYTKEKLDLAYRYHSKLIRSDWFLKNIEGIPRLREFLQKLKTRNIKLGIATGNEHSFLEKLLEYLNLTDLFDLTVCAEDVEHSKPSPDMILKVMEFFQIDERETLFVGDAKNDILAAKSAGVVAVAVLSGVLDRKEAEELKSDFIVNCVKDIYTIAVNR